MKDGLRFVDSDMHIMEPPDLFDRYLDPKFKDRVSVPIGADGRPKRGAAGLTIIDGLPTSDMDLQQYRKRVRNSGSQSTQLLSGSRLFDTGRLDFAVARDYDPVAQVMGMEMEGRRHRGELPHRRSGPARPRRHGSADLAGHLPGVQQLDPRVLRLQPGPAEVGRDAAGARRAPGLPRARALRP